MRDPMELGANFCRAFKTEDTVVSIEFLRNFVRVFHRYPSSILGECGSQTVDHQFGPSDAFSTAGTERVRPRLPPADRSTLKVFLRSSAFQSKILKSRTFHSMAYGVCILCAHTLFTCASVYVHSCFVWKFTIVCSIYASTGCAGVPLVT